VSEGPLEEEGKEEEDSERWLITYADMITLLMAFFIMMYAMSAVDEGRFSALATSVRTEFAGAGLPAGPDVTLVNQGVATSLGIVNGTRFGLQDNVEKGLDKALARTGLRKHVQVLELDGNLVIRLLADKVLFASGSARLMQENRELLSRIATILRVLPFAVRVEGHTDNVPIHTRAFPSNWELSTRRATNVVLYLVRTQGLPVGQFSAAGYADTKPVAPNNTAANREKNRRIDIVVFTREGQVPVVSAEALVQTSPGDRRVADERQIDIVPPINIGGGP